MHGAVFCYFGCECVVHAGGYIIKFCGKRLHDGKLTAFLKNDEYAPGLMTVENNQVVLDHTNLVKRTASSASKEPSQSVAVPLAAQSVAPAASHAATSGSSKDAGRLAPPHIQDPRVEYVKQDNAAFRCLLSQLRSCDTTALSSRSNDLSIMQIVVPEQLQGADTENGAYSMAASAAVYLLDFAAAGKAGAQSMMQV